MRIIAALLLCFHCTVSAAALKDVAYKFEPDKLATVHTPLAFFRSFAPYFYLLERENQQQQPFVRAHWNRSGWCFGDAHLENFGTLLLASGKSIFTVNDWDDAGPCPVILDLFRLAVSAALENPDFDVEPLYQAYQRGLRRQADGAPTLIRELRKKSEEAGMEPLPHLIRNGKFVRSAQAQELTAAEKSEIRIILDQLDSFAGLDSEWVDGIQTSKENGGSFGLTRYQLLLKNKNKFLHLELKEQTTPAIYPVLRGPRLPTVQEKIDNCLNLTQGSQHSKFYGVARVAGKTMLLRPRFAGNRSLNVAEVSSKDFASLVVYEANTLGLLQSASAAPALNLGSRDLSLFQGEARELAIFIKKKFHIVTGR